MSLATNCRWRTRAAWLVMRRASSMASASFSGRSRPVGDPFRGIDQAVGQVLHGLGLALQFTFGRRRNAAGQLAAAHAGMLARAPLPAGRAPVQSAEPMTDPNQYDQHALEAVVERALALAKAGGATAAEAGVSVSTGPLGHGAPGRGRDARVPARPRPRRHGLFGQRKGSASTANLTPAAIEETVAKALSASRASRPTTSARGLPDAERSRATCPISTCASLGARGAEPPSISRALRGCRPRRRPAHQEFRGRVGRDASRLRVFGNSHGFLGGYPSTSHSVSCAVLGQEDGDMQRDYWYTAARDWRELEDGEASAAGRRERAVARLGAASCRRARRPCCSRPSSRAG